MTTSEKTRSLKVERQLAASPDDVFDAWTDPDSLSVWMCPGPGMRVPVAELDARVGGSFRIVMANDETQYDHKGTYQVVDRPRRLRFTWISPATGGGESVVTVDLSPAEGGTRLVLTHEGLPSAESAENHQGGWGNILDTLASHLSS